MSDGTLCVKGRYGCGLHSQRPRATADAPRPRRTTAPFGAAIVERGGLSRRRIGFPDRLLEELGPDALAGLSSAKCTNEENYLFQKFFRQVIGTNNVDHCARLCHSSTVTAMAAALGSGADDERHRRHRLPPTSSSSSVPTPPPPTRSSPRAYPAGRALGQHEAHRHRPPPRSELALGLGRHLRTASAAARDVAVINGLMHLIIRRGAWQNRAFIRGALRGLRRAVGEVSLTIPPGRVEEISGIPAVTPR